MKRFHLTTIFGVFFIFWAAAVFSRPARAQPPLPDDQKLEKLYSGYVLEKMEHFPLVPEISAPEVQEALKAGKAVVVDVRDEAARKVSGISKALSREQFEKTPPAGLAGKKIVFVSFMGVESGTYAAAWVGKSLDVANLTGGILAWVHEGGKLSDEKGETKKIKTGKSDINYAPKAYTLVP